MERWEDVKESYLCRYTGGTRSLYRTSLGTFEKWCEMSGTKPLEASRVGLERYARWLEDEGYKASTRYQRLSVIRGLYRIAHADRVIEHNPALAIRMPQVAYDQTKTIGPSRSQCMSVIEASKGCLRDHALVMILLGLGLRITELCSLNVGEVNGFVRGHRVVTVVGKGNKPASIPLPPMVSRIVDEFVGDRTEGPLFVRRDGQRLERRTAYAWVKRIGKKAGIDNLHPHALRHAAITSALDAGSTLRDVQVFARHADTRTTARYDNNRVNLDRHPAYSVVSYLAN